MDNNRLRTVSSAQTFGRSTIYYRKRLDSDGCAAQRDLEQVVFGIYSINAEGGDATTTPVDVGIVTEGVEVLHDLGDNASACAVLMGVIYAMNLN
ncbi:hypothetical protein G5714_002676 [Onychostoma macrolepis]|uniref:Uncharacterized protein n=1 Tax=Onychostoma macrolepis TaxID=369639 RepID=A0A7J6D7F1_9TELE|nr:hypothetical protein G5714_002676 [Onychostoma macrolepis]